MKTLFALASLVLFSPNVSAPAAEVVFGVEKGKKVTKTFESGMDLELSDLSVKVGDNEVPKEALGDAIEVTMNVKEMLEVVDEYGALDDGLPATLVRTYEKAQREHREHQAQPGQEPKDEKKDKTSQLEGKKVKFTRKDGEYKAAHVDEGGDAAALEKLREDMDLRNLLPGKAVAAGDTWKLETKKVLDALSPGGRNGFKKDEGDDDDDDEFEENCKGDSELTLKEIREEEGHKYAVITLAITGSAQAAKKFEQNEGTMKLEVDLEGELLWDIAAKRFHSFDVQGDATMTIAFTQEADTGGGQMIEIDIEMQMKGKMFSKGTASE